MSHLTGGDPKLALWYSPVNMSSSTSTYVDPTNSYTHASTPSGFHSSGPTTAYTVAAVITAGDSTITAYQVPDTTGLAIVDGTTLTWRQEGITLDNGEVISVGFNGLEDDTTTAFYHPITVSNSQVVSVGSSSTTSYTAASTYVSTNTTATASGSLPPVVGNTTYGSLSSTSPNMVHGSGSLTPSNQNPTASDNGPGTVTSYTTANGGSSGGGGGATTTTRQGGGGGTAAGGSSTSGGFAPTIGAGKAVALVGALGGLVLGGI